MFGKITNRDFRDIPRVHNATCSEWYTDFDSEMYKFWWSKDVDPLKLVKELQHTISTLDPSYSDKEKPKLEAVIEAVKPFADKALAEKALLAAVNKVQKLGLEYSDIVSIIEENSPRGMRMR